VDAVVPTQELQAHRVERRGCDLDQQASIPGENN
jgi:hypothetical protein